MHIIKLERRPCRIDKIFKALADTNRRSLLDELYRNNGQTLNELCVPMTISRQAVTKHLMILEEAELIVVERRGRERRHYLNAAPLGDIYSRWLSKYDQSRAAALEQLKTKLEEEDDE
ncbi:helix-turn-helix domain-containing protein [Halobacillus salinarum]|uniref:Helix-turn-helix domain-containing protein n=1 Tax=Halobacillus salinarum TaxID=2932257 RepID=A0ABY4ELG2_9BACI|nr:helix-turn-helix domain-containing protein [Halobacillus salinarum]UOQ44953.1 helix-turn-helix domain-containing protein [Halobacillus salinarum]